MLRRRPLAEWEHRLYLSIIAGLRIVQIAMIVASGYILWLVLK